jgi:hypothetical protein
VVFFCHQLGSIFVLWWSWFYYFCFQYICYQQFYWKQYRVLFSYGFNLFCLIYIYGVGFILLAMGYRCHQQRGFNLGDLYELASMGKGLFSTSLRVELLELEYFGAFVEPYFWRNNSEKMRWLFIYIKLWRACEPERNIDVGLGFSPLRACE